MQKKRDYVPSLIFGTGEQVRITIVGGGKEWILDLPDSYTDFILKHLKPEETVQDYCNLAILKHGLEILKKQKGGKTTPTRKQKHANSTN